MKYDDAFWKSIVIGAVLIIAFALFLRSTRPRIHPKNVTELIRYKDSADMIRDAIYRAQSLKELEMLDAQVDDLYYSNFDIIGREQSIKCLEVLMNAMASQRAKILKKHAKG